MPLVDALPIAPPASTPAVRAVMRSNRKRDTRPELALRSALSRRGLRYRVDFKIGEGRSAPRPDVAFTRWRVAVFVDGCFWHGCPEHGVRPRTNSTYWDAKIARNRVRDAANAEALALLGWRVIRIWEHEDPQVAAERVEEVVSESGAVRISCEIASEHGRPSDAAWRWSEDGR